MLTFLWTLQFTPRANTASPRFAANPFHQQQVNGVHRPPGFGFNPFDQMALPAMTYLFSPWILDMNHTGRPPGLLAEWHVTEPLGRDFMTKIGWYADPWITEVELTLNWPVQENWVFALRAIPCWGLWDHRLMRLIRVAHPDWRFFRSGGSWLLL